ncbi:MAG: hypothetical protein ACYCVZ_11415 [Streptosporangiaceae bacterium]
MSRHSHAAAAVLHQIGCRASHVGVHAGHAAQTGLRGCAATGVISA